MQSKIKIIGRSATCDLILEHPSVSRQHARVERTDDGRLSIQNNDSRNGTFLYRSKQWIRAERIGLYRGDVLRFGDQELDLERLLALYGPENRVWLPALPEHSLAKGGMKSGAEHPGDVTPKITRPRRNPVTGQIEDGHH